VERGERGVERGEERGEERGGLGERGVEREENQDTQLDCEKVWLLKNYVLCLARQSAATTNPARTITTKEKAMASETKLSERLREHGKGDRDDAYAFEYFEMSEQAEALETALEGYKERSLRFYKADGTYEQFASEEEVIAYRKQCAKLIADQQTALAEAKAEAEKWKKAAEVINNERGWSECEECPYKERIAALEKRKDHSGCINFVRPYPPFVPAPPPVSEPAPKPVVDLDALEKEIQTIIGSYPDNTCIGECYQDMKDEITDAFAKHKEGGK